MGSFCAFFTQNVYDKLMQGVISLQQSMSFSSKTSLWSCRSLVLRVHAKCCQADFILWYMRFLWMLFMEFVVFWFVMLCSLIEIYPYFG